MKDCVLDTHALIWALTKPDRLGKAARRAVDAAGTGKITAFVPAIVLVEVALLEATRRSLPSLDDVREAIERSRGLQVLPLDATDAQAFQELPALIDPFDRLVVAAAAARDLPLVSADDRIREHALTRVIWD